VEEEEESQLLERILLPTDGSRLSDRALSLAALLASAQGAEVILARVVEPVAWTAVDLGPELYDQVIEATEADARSGLETLSTALGERGVTARSVVLKGSAAGELLALEEREKPDLVVMATHGRTGLARFALGSIADRLVREGVTPVLLARSFGPEVNRLEAALVPLDGSPLAEQALVMVESLADKPLRRVRLVRAIDSNDQMPSAMQYMANVGVRLEKIGFDVSQQVLVGDPARVIEDEAESVDVVILATHGRSGLDRFRHGSIAEKATRSLAAPVLLVKARENNGK
jgi:nucleotide-binding universal stress UspA family protein